MWPFVRQAADTLLEHPRHWTREKALGFVAQLNVRNEDHRGLVHAKLRQLEAHMLEDMRPPLTVSVAGVLATPESKLPIQMLVFKHTHLALRRWL